MSRVLLIGSSFFGYRNRIAEELSFQGHEVDSVDDRPSEGVFFKSISRILPSILSVLVSSHAKALCEKINVGNYDYVIYLGGMTFFFTRSQISCMKRAAPDCEFIAYLWDSLANSPCLDACLDLFDRVLSFEPDDCESSGLELRPLFFSKMYAGFSLGSAEKFEWDVCFIGSVHQPSKFKAVHEMVNSLREDGLRVFVYYYMPSRSIELLRKVQCAEYRGVDFEHKPLSGARAAEIYSLSRAVIDSPQSNQRGLTMRTLETVGACRKLITTNLDAVFYDFSLPGNVITWNNAKENYISDFLQVPYETLPSSVYESYSLGFFVKALIGRGPKYEGYEKGKISTGKSDD